MNKSQEAPPAFFSYAREDSDFVLRLAGDLKAAGTAVWLDQLDIQPGQRWDGAVEEALTRCVRMLVVLSPAAVNSTNVMDEVSFALEEGKTIIPIIHRDCAIPFRLRRVQYLDFREDYAQALNALVRTLVSGTVMVLNRPAQPVSSDNAAEAPLTEQQRTLEQTVSDREQALAVEMQQEDDQRRQAEANPQRQIEESRREHQRRQAADQRTQEYGPTAVVVVDQPRGRHTFDLATLWPLVDRFGGLCWLVLAVALPALLGLSPQEFLAATDWHAKILGIACPAIAAVVPAIPLRRVAIKYITTTFASVSLLTPMLGLFEMRAGIRATGSASLGAVAAGLAEILLTLPFLVAGLFAVAATTLPTVPVSLHAKTRVALLVASTLVVVIVAKNISEFALMTSLGLQNEWPWFAEWLVRLVAPS